MTARTQQENRATRRPDPRCPAAESARPRIHVAVTATRRELYPGCPPEEADRIAAWTCRKHSGRVGQSAAAKGFDPQVLRLAVIAHVRHEHTDYDKLLMRCGGSAQAWEQFRDKTKRRFRAHTNVRASVWLPFVRKALPPRTIRPTHAR